MRRPSASSASLAPRCSTRAPRIGPSGGRSPRASISLRRSGRSHTNSLSATRHCPRPRETRSLVCGSASARRRTSSKPANVPTLPRAAGDLPVAQLYEAAERADVGGAVGSDADRGVVAVEAEPRARELFIHGGAGSEGECAQIPGVDFVRSWRLGVRVYEAVGERELGHGVGRPLRAVPDRVAAGAFGVDVDALDSGRGGGAFLGSSGTGVAEVVLDDDRVAGADQGVIGRAFG